MPTKREKLEQDRVALINAKTQPHLLAQLTPCGYGVEKLDEGLLLCIHAQDLVKTCQEVHQSKTDATDDFDQTFERMEFIYYNHRRIARVSVRRHPEIRHSLQLQGVRHKGYLSCLTHAKEFYNTLLTNPELLALLALMGLTREQIEEVLQLIDQVEMARARQLAEEKREEEARLECKRAADAFEAWNTPFRKYARVTFHSSPADMKMLGFGAPARKKKETQPVAPSVLPPVEEPVEQPVSGRP